MQKLPMQTLETTFKTSTVKLLWPKQFEFVVENAYAYLNAEPAVLMALDKDCFSVAQLISVQRRMDEKAEQARVQKEDDDRLAAYDKATEARKAISGLNLTGGHR
jgi:hypothetical protein